MKIFLLTDSMDIGGAETHVYELARLFSLRGHRVTVLSAGGRMAGGLPRVGVRHLALPPLTDPRTLPAALLALDKYIRRDKPHIVHAHTRRSAFLCRVLLATFDFPLVVTAHAVFSARFPWNRLSVFPPSTIAVSSDIKRWLVEGFSVPEGHITVIPNGIDTRRFAPHSAEGRLLTVLTVSRLDRDCAHTARLLCAVAPALARRLRRPVRILIAGDGDAAPEIRVLAEQANRRAGYAAITLVGARTDVHRLLGECHIFVGVSRAALEAMSAAKPVILSGDEGYLGIVDEGSFAAARRANFCARGYAPANGEGLVRDLVRLAELAPSEREALGAWGREAVRSFYSIEEMADATEKVYRRELARFRSTRRSDAFICGYYGYGNCGDELVLTSILDGQRALTPGVRLSVLTAKHHSPQGVRGVYRYDLWSVVREMRGTGAFIFGGGSLLQDATSLRSLLYYLSLLALARRFGVPTMLYANGLGPLSPRSLALCRRMLSAADVISLRDRASYRAVRAMGLPGTRVMLGADPVLASDRGERTPPRIPPYLALFPKGGSTRAEELALSRAVSALAVQLDAEVMLAAMSAAEDGETVERIAEHLRRLGVRRVTVGSTHPQAVEHAIRRAELVVSERLHALILAFSHGVPAIGIDRDPKIPAFLCDVGAPHSTVPPAPADLRAAASRTFPPSPAIRATLRRRAARDARVANRLIWRG